MKRFVVIDRVLPPGLGNRAIKKALENTKQISLQICLNGQVEQRSGDGWTTSVRAYVMSSPMEYFAECSEAFSTNDFFQSLAIKWNKRDTLSPTQREHARSQWQLFKDWWSNWPGSVDRFAPPLAFFSRRRIAYANEPIERSSRYHDFGETLVSKEKIEDLLRQLHDELAEAEDVDADLSEKLRGAAAEIQTALERQYPMEDVSDSQTEGEPGGVIEQLRDAAERFEDSHPTLTNTVGRIADALSQLGI